MSVVSVAVIRSRETSHHGLLDQLNFDDGVGWLALGFAVFLAAVAFGVWVVRLYRKRKEEAALVTSHYRLVGGMGLAWVYEISVHNASPHPLRIVEVQYWDGAEWRPMLARSITTGDPVLLPGAVGVATVPAMTTGMTSTSTTSTASPTPGTEGGHDASIARISSPGVSVDS